MNMNGSSKNSSVQKERHSLTTMKPKNIKSPKPSNFAIATGLFSPKKNGTKKTKERSFFEQSIEEKTVKIKIEDIESPKSRRDQKKTSSRQINKNGLSYFNNLTKSKEERSTSRAKKNNFASPQLLIKKKIQDDAAISVGEIYKQKYLGYTKYGNKKSTKSKKNIKRMRPKRSSKESYKDIRQQNSNISNSVRNEISQRTLNDSDVQKTRQSARMKRDNHLKEVKDSVYDKIMGSGQIRQNQKIQTMRVSQVRQDSAGENVEHRSLELGQNPSKRTILKGKKKQNTGSQFVS